MHRRRPRRPISPDPLRREFIAGSRSIEELFEELMRLSRNLDDEQERHVREDMTEEELVIFDILTRPAPDLSSEERSEVKKVARDLLERLKELLVLNWRQKCSALFEHVYENYPEKDASVYSRAV